MKNDPLVAARLIAEVEVPHLLSDFAHLSIEEGDPTQALQDQGEVASRFPHTYGQPDLSFVGKGEMKQKGPLRIGVVLSGGQAPGGHNVIAGVYDALQKLHKGSLLYGFLGGPSGLVENRSMELGKAKIDGCRNTGGFNLIGSGRTKIETPEQLAASLGTVEALSLDGVVIIGGDDSNTNAALLAEYFKDSGSACVVVGVPKTIDGDLKGPQIPISFGHDTACRVYSELIGNIMRDCLSAKKYYHFIRLMGRSASHVTLECALITHPTLTLIGEEVKASRCTLREVVERISSLVIRRAEEGRFYGVIVIPEGLIEFIPEVGALIRELNALLADDLHEKRIQELSSVEDRVAYLLPYLSADSQSCYETLPHRIQGQLLVDRDPHGNVQVSRIETERLLLDLVRLELEKRALPFNGVHHFFGYEGRSALPTPFDSAYCQALGMVAALLVADGRSGYMASLTNLHQMIAEWEPRGIPLTKMMRMEERKGKRKCVIQKALVDLKGPAFQALVEHEREWEAEDQFGYPGPIQFAGNPEVTDRRPMTLLLEAGLSGCTSPAPVLH